MKKSIIIVIVSALLLMPALGNSPKKSKAKDSSYTPENSVVFYGKFRGNKKTVYFQSNQEMGVDRQEFKGSIIVSDPVQPGSNYRLFSFNGKGKRIMKDYYGFPGLVTCEWESAFALNYSEFDLKIPTEPGLYYIGNYDGYDSSNKLKYIESEKDEYQAQIKALKEALKKYKGTEWEKVISEKIEELKNEKEN